MLLRSSTPAFAEKHGVFSPSHHVHPAPTILVARSTVCDGYGVFANRTFQPDAFITVYAGDVRPVADLSREQRRYTMTYWDGSHLIGEHSLDKLQGRGVAQLLNDALCSCVTGVKNNCEFFQYNGDTHVYVRALRRIVKGEELLASYGLPYWSNFLCDLPVNMQETMNSHIDDGVTCDGDD